MNYPYRRILAPFPTDLRLVFSQNIP